MMPTVPGMPDIPEEGLRRQRATQLRAEIEAMQRQQEAAVPSQEDQGREAEDKLEPTGASRLDENERAEELEYEEELDYENQQSYADVEEEDHEPLAEEEDEVEDDEDETGPVGVGEHLVREGECISSIAKDTGHFWETIWNDPSNAKLKEVRKNPNVLLPNDRATIPQLQKKQEPCEAEIRHRFVRRGEPAMLRLRVLTDPETLLGCRARDLSDAEEEEYSDEDSIEEPDVETGERIVADDASENNIEATGSEEPQAVPLANKPYVLKVDDQEFEGMTDANGGLEVFIPGDAKRGKLLVGNQPNPVEYDLVLGSVDPIRELTGVQHRLNNLGLDCGSADGQFGAYTHAALERFQECHGLPKTGQPDEQTCQRLEKEHGS